MAKKDLAKQCIAEEHSQTIHGNKCQAMRAKDTRPKQQQTTHVLTHEIHGQPCHGQLNDRQTKMCQTNNMANTMHGKTQT